MSSNIYQKYLSSTALFIDELYKFASVVNQNMMHKIHIYETNCGTRNEGYIYIRTDEQHIIMTSILVRARSMENYETEVAPRDLCTCAGGDSYIYTTLVKK